MEAKSISIYRTAHFRIPEDIDLHSHFCENLEPQTDYGSAIIMYSGDGRMCVKQTLGFGTALPTILPVPRSYNISTFFKHHICIEDMFLLYLSLFTSCNNIMYLMTLMSCLRRFESRKDILAS